MKKTVLSLIVSVFGLVGHAHAISCPDSLGVTFPPAQKEKLCEYFVNTASLTGSLTFAGVGPIVAPTALSFAVGAATTPNYTLDNAKLLMPNTGVLAAPTAIALAVGAASTPNITFNNAGVSFSTAGMGVRLVTYVPTMAATPAAGTNVFQPNSLNVVPTAAANTAALLPATPIPGDTFEIVNSGPNAVRIKAGGAATMNGATAGGYVVLATLAKAYCSATAAANYNCELPAAPTPAGP